MQLRPISFDYIEGYSLDNSRQIGFLAEEVEQISPLLVKYANDQVKNVRYKQMTVLLTKAIQEQQEQIELLKEGNQMLKAELCARDSSYSWC